jgi:IS30 family transposase
MLGGDLNHHLRCQEKHRKSKFATISEAGIEFVNRPRKCFGFKSSNQISFNHLSIVALRN